MASQDTRQIVKYDQQETVPVQQGQPGGLPECVGFPSAADMSMAIDFAARIAGTEFVPDALRGKPAAVLACVLTGRELGIGPMQSLQKINVIKGKVSLSSELMRSLVLSRGHQLWTEEYTNDKVTVNGRRAGEQRIHSVTWTIQDARNAQLAGGAGASGMYQKYPRSMLLARATSELCRAVFADVLSGFSYAPEDIEAIAEDRAEAPVPDPKPATVIERAKAANAATESAIPKPVSLERTRQRLRDLMTSKGFDAWQQDPHVEHLPALREEEQRAEIARIWDLVKGGTLKPGDAPAHVAAGAVVEAEEVDEFAEPPAGLLDGAD